MYPERKKCTPHKHYIHSTATKHLKYRMNSK